MGLSALAQVKGRNAITEEEKLDWDLEYIKKLSLIGNVKILLETVAAVFMRSSFTDGENATTLDCGNVPLKTGKISREKHDAKQAHEKNTKNMRKEVYNGKI